MKVAVIVSGQIRTFINNIQSWNDYLTSQYDCDFYFNIWDVYGNGGHKLRYEYSNDLVSINDILNIYTKFKPKSIEIENYEFKNNFFLSKESTFYTGHPYISNIYSMWYKLGKAVRMVDKNTYDVVLRLRPDHLLSERLELTRPEVNTIYCDISYSWNPEIISDQFFYGDYSSMMTACALLESINIFYSPTNPPISPEHLFYRYLKHANLNMDLKRYDSIKINRAKEQDYH